jgi:hypothetical protein
MKIRLSEVRQMINAQIKSSILESFKPSDMPSGTSWQVIGEGWAAKNRNGVTNYWYGADTTKNQQAADRFRNNSTK